MRPQHTEVFSAPQWQVGVAEIDDPPPEPTIEKPFCLSTDVRDSYTERIRGRLRSVDAERLSACVNAHPDFTCWLQDGKIEIDWLERERDYQHWKSVLLQLAQPDILKKGKEGFGGYVRGVVETHARNNPDSYFATLNDEKIEVSPGHRGTTPLMHTFHVVDRISTKHYHPREDHLLGVFKLRIAALFHDIGKRIIANGDSYQFHALISELIMRDFLTQLAADRETMQVLSDNLNVNVSELEMTFDEIPVLIGLHHAAELHSRSLPTDATTPLLSAEQIFEARKRVPDVLGTMIPDLIALGRADVRSVHGYEHFEASSFALVMQLFKAAMENKAGAIRVLEDNWSVIKPIIKRALRGLKEPQKLMDNPNTAVENKKRALNEMIVALDGLSEEAERFVIAIRMGSIICPNTILEWVENRFLTIVPDLRESLRQCSEMLLEQQKTQSLASEKAV